MVRHPRGRAYNLRHCDAHPGARGNFYPGFGRVLRAGTRAFVFDPFLFPAQPLVDADTGGLLHRGRGRDPGWQPLRADRLASRHPPVLPWRGISRDLPVLSPAAAYALEPPGRLHHRFRLLPVPPGNPPCPLEHPLARGAAPGGASHSDLDRIHRQAGRSRI